MDQPHYLPEDILPNCMILSDKDLAYMKNGLFFYTVPLFITQ